jgi:hypothetical protein
MDGQRSAGHSFSHNIILDPNPSVLVKYSSCDYIIKKDL